ncbi:MAG: FAD-dependent oxidoreductase [Rariglobus sp.]
MASFAYSLPVADVVVVGGSIAGVSAALALHSVGLKVVLLSGRTYLGEGVCDSLNLRLPEACDVRHPLALRLLGEALEADALLRPLHIKLELERALRKAGVPVLLATTPGEIVRAAGAFVGLTICNRSGRQFLPCRAILDSTVRGEVARMAGVTLTAPVENFPVIRRVIGGEPPATDTAGSQISGHWEAEGKVAFVVNDETRLATLWAWHTQGSLADGSWASWMKLEQVVRLVSYRPGQDFSADGIAAFTGERLHPGSPPEPLATVTPVAISTADRRLWFTGPIANLDEAGRSAIIRPDRAVMWGEEVAARLVAHLPPLIPRGAEGLKSSGRDLLPAGIEACDLASSSRGLPDGGFAAVYEVDVLVVGGGTGGAPAGIAAARAGARTLVAEFLSGLGGVGTLGLIGQYWYGNRVGFTAEMDRAVTAKSPKKMREDAWDVEAKMQWYHEEITRVGGDVWYKTMVCGALKEGTRLVGAILATPQGRVAVRAKCVVDATGSADVAAAAGAETVAIGDAHLAVQGTGLPPRAPGVNYTNTDYDFIDDSNARDAGSAHVTAREKFAHAFDTGQLVDSRERRRIVGDYEVTPMDIRLARIFPDTINKARSNFDTHGFTVHPLFMIVPPDHDARVGYVPLRALLPRGFEGVLVTGLGISAHRDAMPVIRMQADVQNQGYAAGLAAALSGAAPIRDLPVENLQRRLVELGILDDGMVCPPDTFPLSDDEIARSLAAAVDDPEQIDRIFTTDEVTRIAWLRTAYVGAGESRARRFYAFVLGMLGDATGAEELAAEVAGTAWDTGWNYRGMHQFGASMSPLDARIIALGRCRRADLLPVLIAKAAELPADTAFSHYRALAEAFETIGDAAAAPVLEKLLNRPGLTGHQRTDVTARVATASADSNENSFRNASLIELHLARALHRVDPAHPRGREILESYRHDQRALFARHAEKLLSADTP